MPTSSKRNPFTETQTREQTGARSEAEPTAETCRTARSSPAPRSSRGASTIPAPRKAELHRVMLPARPFPTHEQIARRAYEIWVQGGCVTGRDTDNWAQAERELSAGCAAPESSAHQA